LNKPGKFPGVPGCSSTNGDHLNSFFASGKNCPGSKNEQIILIPFSEATALSTELAQNEPNTIGSEADKDADPRNENISTNKASGDANQILPHNGDSSPDTQVHSKESDVSHANSARDDPSQTAYRSKIKLHHTTPEMLKTVINGLKKPALTAWATSCGILSSKNPVGNKRKLCELLDSCTSEFNEKTTALITLLIKKLDDCTIKMELLANGLPLSTSAAERKSDLVNHLNNKHHGATSMIEFAATLDDYASQDRQPASQPGPPGLGKTPDIQPSPIISKSMTSMNISTQDHKTVANRNKKHRKKAKRRADPTPRDQFCTDSPLVKPTYDSRVTTSISNENVPTKDGVAFTKITSECKSEHTAQVDTGQTNPVCNSCSDLKLSLTILQDSIVMLKEEMLQQKAISDLNNILQHVI
jgi:hypothetical protein